jgi:hypothetical protein
MAPYDRSTALVSHRDSKRASKLYRPAAGLERMRARTVRVSDPKLIAGLASEAYHLMVIHFTHPARGGEDVAECDLL